MDSPALWSPDSPTLYTLETTIYDEDGMVMDRNTERFGIRKFEFKDNQLYINGKRLTCVG